MHRAFAHYHIKSGSGHDGPAELALCASEYAYKAIHLHSILCRSLLSMGNTRRRLFAFCILFLIAALAPQLFSAPGAGNTEEVTIYRDQFGTPNIFAATEEGAAYGMGYAQAEDRLEEIFKQYRRAEGTLAEVFGPQFFQDDYRQRVWQHRAVSEANYPKLSAKLRGIIEAYQAGVKQYMDEHPDQVPDWAPKLEPWQIVALGRYIIWGWPEGDAGGDLQRAGIRHDPVSPRASNEATLAAQH